MMRSMWLYYPKDKPASKTAGQFIWDNSERRLTIQPPSRNNIGSLNKRVFKLELIPQGVTKEVIYSGKKTEILF
jgi:hypothetical protein